MSNKVKAVNSYGLDKELAEKAAAKYDHRAEAEAQMWIETLTGITFDKEFGEMLKDGVVLCHLINAVDPGKIPERKIYTKGKMPFKMMENITTFIKYARSRGVGESELFTTVALFETKGMVAYAQSDGRANLIPCCFFRSWPSRPLHTRIRSHYTICPRI